MWGILIDVMERGYAPDALIRLGVRHLSKKRLNDLHVKTSTEVDYVNDLKKGPIAIATKEANQQHYEVPSEFFQIVLGPHRKYSSTFWPPECRSLANAEALALEETINRAQIVDGMKILELGCGWGSLTLAMAARFPNSQIFAVSNSASQRKYIEAQLKERHHQNVQVLTRNLAETESLGEKDFDRVVSLEMLEHFRNYEAFFARVAGWMKPEGKFFIHIFTHRQHSYPFETEGDDNWMGKYFFTGGQMPSRALLSYFQKDFLLEKQWEWDGTHYQKTSEAWLKNMDLHRPQIMELFRRTYGEENATRWLHRWRVFFIAVAEIFGYKGGTEWGVSHYLFTRRKELL